MITKEQIQDIITSKLTDNSIFIVDIKVDSANKILVEADADNGLTIDMCVKISRIIEQTLDRDKEDFALEVASPGAGKPFKVTRQYIKNIGKTVEVKLIEENKKIEGILESAGDEGIVIREIYPVTVKGRKPKMSGETKSIKYQEINQTKVILSFN